MSGPVLVVMAADLRSRYGGLKQIDPVGPSGEITTDHSIYDARRTGLEKSSLSYKEDIEEAFQARAGGAVRNLFHRVAYPDNLWG